MNEVLQRDNTQRKLEADCEQANSVCRSREKNHLEVGLVTIIF